MGLVKDQSFYHTKTSQLFDEYYVLANVTLTGLRPKTKKKTLYHTDNPSLPSPVIHSSNFTYLEKSRGNSVIFWPIIF